MKRLSGVLFLSLLLVGKSALAQAAQAPADPELRALIARISAQAAVELAKDNVGSLTLGVVSGPDLVWTQSYGKADMEKGIPATKETIYRIGSITKQFTALLLLQLVQEGKIHFSDPVEQYYPEINKIPGRSPGAPPITWIQLATHTSGLAPEPDDPEPYLKGPVADWEKVLFAALPHTRYAYEPGTRYSYSNIGYAVLGAALSRAAGRPYVDAVQQRIFKPLGMKSTFFAPDAQTRPRIAKGYLSEDGKLDWQTADREHQGRGYKVPNGAIYTTVEDLARFVAFEMGEGPAEVLKKESLEENFKRLVTANATFKRGYGVGFQVLRLGDAVLYGHSGGVAGYQAEAYFDRGSRTGVIVLTSVVGSQLDPTNLLRAAFEKPAPTSPARSSAF